MIEATEQLLTADQQFPPEEDLFVKTDRASIRYNLLAIQALFYSGAIHRRMLMPPVQDIFFDDTAESALDLQSHTATFGIGQVVARTSTEAQKSVAVKRRELRKRYEVENPEWLQRWEYGQFKTDMVEKFPAMLQDEMIRLSFGVAYALTQRSGSGTGSLVKPVQNLNLKKIREELPRDPFIKRSLARVVSGVPVFGPDDPYYCEL